MRERKGTKGEEERLVLPLLSFRGVGGTCGKATRGRGERGITKKLVAKKVENYEKMKVKNILFFK